MKNGAVSKYKYTQNEFNVEKGKLTKSVPIQRITSHLVFSPPAQSINSGEEENSKSY